MSAITEFTGKFGLRHLQTLLMLLAYFIAYTMHSCMSIAVVAMTDTKSNRTDIPILDWPVDKRSLILSSDLWGTVAAQIPFGFVVMKYNAQKIMAGAVLICSFMYFLIPTLAVKVGWSALLCSTVVVGLGLAAIEPAQQSLFSRWIPPSERARLVTIVVSGGNLGIVFSMLVSGLLAGSSYGWPSLFYAFGGIALGWSLLFFFVAANGPSQHPWITPEERHYIESSLGVVEQNIETKHLKFPWKSVVTSVPVWAYLICMCCHIWCFYVTMTQLPSFIKNDLDYDISKTGGISALPYIFKTLFAPIIGWFSDWTLRHGAHISTVRKVSNTIGMWGPAATLLTLCLIQPSNRIVVVAILVVTITLHSTIICGHFLNALDLTPNFSGTVYSIVNTIAKLFGLVAPIACGAIVGEKETSIERWHIVFYISVITYFFGNLMFILFGSAEKQSWNNPKPADEHVTELSTAKKYRDGEFNGKENLSYVEK